MIWIIDFILLALIVVFFLYPRWTLKRNAKVVEAPEFERLMATSQLIDVREAADFRVKHILGARNLPASQIEQSLNAINKRNLCYFMKMVNQQLQSKLLNNSKSWRTRSLYS